MKLFSRFTSAFCKAAAVLAVSCAGVVSCTALQEQYDDLQDQIDLIVDKIFELEQRLNDELGALKDMLAGKILITDVSTDASTMITTVTLSNGTKLTLYPKADMESYITYVEASVDGEMVPCWAYIDENGKKKLFKDKDGKPIPVETVTPEVVVKDGDTFLVIGGSEYPLSGNSVFSDYELVTDELTGEVYAVTFTFGEDMTFTVTVDGACGFHFVQAAGWSTVIIEDYFVAPGLTERVQIDARGVVDYVLQIPDGWRVKEYSDVYMGTRYFEISAPSEELIESGVAAANGELKVVAVLEGGKATVARLYLSTDPFKEFKVSLGKADVKMYNGLQKFVYGFCAKADYDEASVFDVAESLLTAFDYPKGYGVSDFDLVGLPVADILGEEPVPGDEYVFWAIPALYWQTDVDAGYYVNEGTFVHETVKYSSVKFEIGRETFRDAQLEMELKGVDAYYIGLIPAVEYMVEDVLYSLNNGYLDKQTEPMKYSGSVFAFADVEGQQNTDYVVWFAVAEDGRTYTEADVIVREFSTQTLTAGGSVEVTAEIKAGAIDIQADLTAKGAETIYYSFLTTSDAKKYADDKSRAEYLFEKGLFVKAESVNVKASETVSKIKPETSFVLMAVAADSEGMYGKVLYEECATGKIEYNSLQVAIELVRNEPDDVRLSISAKGGNAAGYLYWIGKTSENTWKSPNYLGGSVETAQVYMYLNSDHSRFATVAEKYPIQDGIITMNDLAYETEYVIVAMAKDNEGSYSPATALKFSPRSISLGEVVTSSDPKWEAAKPTVEWLEYMFEPAKGMMSGQYSCMVTLVEDMTAYVLLGTDYELCGSDVPFEMTVEEKIISVIQNTDGPRDSDTPDPSIPEDEYKSLTWPDGNIFYHHEHGHPLFGNAVIWADKETHEAKCGCGKEGVTQRTMANGITIDVNNVILYNDGSPIEFRQPQAIGSTKEVVDKVFIVCQDREGNCYETYVFDVPFELFANATGKE